MTLFLATPAINGILSRFVSSKNSKIDHQKTQQQMLNDIVFEYGGGDIIFSTKTKKRNCEYCNTLLQTEMTNCRNCGAPIRYV